VVENDTDSDKFVEQLGNIDISDSTTNDGKQTVFAVEQQANVGLQDCWAKTRKGSNDFLVRKDLLYKRIPTYVTSVNEIEYALCIPASREHILLCPWHAISHGSVERLNH